MTVQRADLKLMKQVTFPGPFPLESGGELPELRIAYHSWGDPDCERVIWVFHALTANSEVSDWWSGLFGAGRLLDPGRFRIVCANVVGSCYGSTCPADLPGAAEFPLISIRDMVAAHRLLADHLGIDQIYLGIGGSLGGQQLLEWSVEEPGRFHHIVPIATNARHSPWGIAFNEAQRMAIEAGAKAGKDGARQGMEAARAVALLSYRHYQAYGQTQAEESDDKWADFRAASYQRYQGLKLGRRFEVESYLSLSRSMDTHNLGRGRGGIAQALQRILADTLVIGISSDLLFPPEEQLELVQHIKNSRLLVINSTFGHDGFLVELDHIQEAVSAFLEGRIEKAPLPFGEMRDKPGSWPLPGTESF